MKRIKLFMVTVMITALLVSSVTVGAATGSVQKTKIDSSNTKVTTATMKYNGKSQKVVASIVVDGKTLKLGTDYIISIPDVKNAGTYNLTTTITGIGHYEGAYKVTVKVTVAKSAQALKKTGAKKVKASALKSKSVKVKLKVKATGKGKLVYKKVSKNLSVSKKGVVTVKKGTKKGTYIVKVKAKATKNYNQTKWKKIKIKVK